MTTRPVRRSADAAMTGTLGVTSKLIDQPCPRCRWPFVVNDVVEVIDGSRRVVVHEVCPRSDPPPVPLDRKARRARWAALSDSEKSDVLVLTESERERYLEGRW